MAEDAFSTWLTRGLAHQREGRAADAIPSLRRAARENPRSPLPSFHIGQALWQLGLRAEAVSAWRASADLDRQFVAPRLALAEAAMADGDFPTAATVASQAVAIDSNDSRTRATALAARAAIGDANACREAASTFASDPTPAASPSIAAALAAALDRDGVEAQRLRDALAPQIAGLPTMLVASLVAQGVAIPQDVASRAFTPADLPALRRLALVSGNDLKDRFAHAYCAIAAALPGPPVPLLWPQRTGGHKLRLAFMQPEIGSKAWDPARRALHAIATTFGDDGIALLLLCTGNVEMTRTALAGTMPREAIYVALPEQADADIARIVAARDCDVLVDAAGLAADTARMLAARPAREIWALDTAVAMSCPPIVQRTFADADELVAALHGLRLIPRDGATAEALAQTWDAAVGNHQQGDLERAGAGYDEVLLHQPQFAPALHLRGVIAQTRGDHERAAASFAAALAEEPRFLEARLSAAEAAMAMHDHERARSVVQQGLDAVPYEVALLRMLARIEMHRRDAVAAEAAIRRLLLFAPADAQAHFDHGVALQRMGDSQGAARAYQRALTFRPDLIAADFNLGVLFDQQGNRRAAEAAYRHVLGVDRAHVAAYKHLGELLLAAGEIDAWLANFHAFEKACPAAMPLAVYALEACQHEGDFAKLDRYLDGLRRDEFAARDEEELADCLESLLYLLLFFDVDASLMLRLAQAYDAVAPKVYGGRIPLSATRRPGRMRVGYLSADLRNHVMGKMMWQAIEHHDRERFDLYFYSAGSQHDDWTARFASVATRFVDISTMADDAAVAQIVADDLDLLVDLSTHTKGSRPGILVRKPARVQLTHVASAGTLGLSQVDFKLTDRFADVAENQEFQLERLLAMEGCVYPYRHVAPASEHPFNRHTLGVAHDAIVIGAFVNPLKLSRRCLRLWRDVLERVPRARIAFSPANPAMQASYLRVLSAAGIASDRVIFLPQGRDDAQNQARYAVVDFVLDTMPFGGVNGTLEALDMSVPVVTLVGKRHGERTTYSILANLGVASTVAQTGRDYVEIAARLADDTAFRASVRSAIAAGIAKSPLTDMLAHTRHLEAAYLAAIDQRE